MLEPLQNSLRPVNLPLDSLYLDPNNPRFATDDMVREPDNRIDNEAIQEGLLSNIRQRFGLKPLMDSMEQNGYVPIDQIVVREFDDNKYVVLEGNRRIAAAKHLMNQHAEGRLELTEEIRETLRHIPAVLYFGQDRDAAWVFQGIRHISGPKDWPAYQKARLLVEQMEEYDLNFTQAGRIFGLSAIAAGQYVRGYYAYQQAKNHPSYEEDIEPRAFSYFQELFGRSNVALRDQWLDWNDEIKQFRNENRFETFLSWLYPKRNEHGEEDPDQPGDWEQRRIPRVIDLRDVSTLYADYPEQFTQFLQGTELSTAAGVAKAKEQSRKQDIEYFIQEIHDFSELMEDLPLMKIVGEEDLDEFIEATRNLNDILNETVQAIQAVQAAQLAARNE